MCPSFNFIDSFHTIIKKGCSFIEGENDLKDEIHNLLNKNDLNSIFKALLMIPAEIRTIVYGFNKFSEEINAFMNSNSPSEAEMIRSNNHQQAVFSENEVFDDYTVKLKDIKCMSLLLVGSEDPVCSHYQRNKFVDCVVNGRIVSIENSSHFPYLDSIDETVSIIDNFLIE